MNTRWRAWVAFWDEREDPLSLACARILLGLCWTYDFLYIWLADLVRPLFAVAEAGGFSDALLRKETPWLYVLFPGTMTTATVHFAVMLISAIAVMVGFYTRAASAVLLLAWAAFADVMPHADRGIDTLSRFALIILAVSPAGRAWSVDARLATGTWSGDGQPAPAFARRLLVFQLVLMYFVAGVSKVGLMWWPAGHYTALYYALQDPAVAAADFSWLGRQPFFFFTQLGSAATVLYQVTYPLVLPIFYWRRHPERAGRVGRFAIRWRLEWWWIGCGGIFHLLLALTMTLGIFPWAMLALYPVWFSPDELRAFGRWWSSTLEQAISR